MTDAIADTMAALHSANNARFGEVMGASLPLGYGDFSGEVEALRQAVGILDLASCGVVMVRGPDCDEFLGGLTTNDLKSLPPGRMQPDLLCGTKGKILHPIDVVRAKPDQLLVITEPGARDAVAGHLEAYHIREEVEIGLVPLVRIDLIGPASAPAALDLGYSASEPLATFQEAPLLILDHPLGMVPRRMTLLPEGTAAGWVEALLTTARDGRLTGFEALDDIRISAGVPRWGVDFHRDHLPAEASLHDRISFNKGCYIGQEVHARLHYRGHVNRKLMALEVPEEAAAALASGQALYEGETSAATLTSLARLPVAGKVRGIAMVRREQASPGTPLSAQPGAAAEIRLASLATDLGRAGS